jgi:hypothetical protein
MKIYFYALVFCLMIVGFSFNMYFAATLPREPIGQRTHIIDLGKGPKVFGTDREYYYAEAAKWMAITAIAAGTLVTAINVRLRAKPDDSKK